jgi:hypothetical protein
MSFLSYPQAGYSWFGFKHHFFKDRQVFLAAVHRKNISDELGCACDGIIMFTGCFMPFFVAVR